MSAPPGQPPVRGYVDPNFPNSGHPGNAPVIIYGYTPSFVLGIIAIVVFLITGIGHTFQTFKYRTWYFSTMIIGILFVRLLSLRSSQIPNSNPLTPT